MHHRDAITDVADHRQVVRDEEEGEVELLLQVVEQADDLSLGRHVERADRLVGDDEPRPDRQRPRQRDALELTPRELMRVAVDERAVEVHLVEEITDPLVALLAGHVEVLLERLPDVVGNRRPWVERRVRVLEDHLTGAAQRPQLRFGQTGDVVTGEDDTPRRGLDEAQRKASERRLARTGLAHQPDGLT